MVPHLPSEMGSVQEALELGLGLEPQVGQAQRLMAQLWEVSMVL